MPRSSALTVTWPGGIGDPLGPSARITTGGRRKYRKTPRHKNKSRKHRTRKTGRKTQKRRRGFLGLF